MKIQVLAPEVVQQIAAGEVLERPSFLVKELIENSLDAGASEIEIDVAQGGLQLSVSDNGHGIDKQNLPRALQAHATSKIKSTKDIYKLSTFGFRGEALAAAAAVSHLKITSRTHDSEHGAHVVAEFGKIEDALSVSSTKGTKVEVQKLFENVPARLKFLKSESAETSQIKNTVKALALANENVSLRLLQEGVLKFFWAAQKTLQPRAEEIIGVPLLHNELRDEDLQVECWVSAPNQAAQTSRNLWFFVQGRWIQDRSLQAAVNEAYRNLLMHGEYPQGVIRIQLAPEEVDVNVHPTKSQVKFRDPQRIFRAVMRCVRGILEQSPWLKESAPIGTTASYTLSMRDEQFHRVQYPQKSFPSVSMPTTQIEPIAPSPLVILSSAPQFHWAQLEVVGQIHLTYIAAQSEEAFYLIDQHAAHERVMFEKLMAQFKAGKFDVQNYLLPLVVDLSAPEVEALVRHQTDILSLGISIEQMGPEAVAVQATPSFVTEAGVVEAIRRFAVDLVENSGSFALERKVGDWLASMACHSAIRAGQSLSAQEMKNLLLQMDEYPLSSFCPHGRPVYVRRYFAELDREFGRLV